MKKKVILLILIIVMMGGLFGFTYINNVAKKQNEQIKQLKQELKMQEVALNKKRVELSSKSQEIAELQNEIQAKQEQINALEQEASKPKTVEQMFAKASETYGVDYNMLMGIARLETGNFTSSLWRNNNNPGGMRGGSGWMSFPSQEDGIMYMASLLRNNYLNRGLTTLEQIGSVYCPDTYQDWANKVRSLM